VQVVHIYTYTEREREEEDTGGKIPNKKVDDGDCDCDDHESTS
jgi:hypothetical protein